MATITGSGAIYVDPYLKLLIEVSKVGDVEMAREILRMMSNQGLEMDDVTARLLARAYGVNGQTNEMSKILTEQYAKNGGLDPALEMGFFSVGMPKRLDFSVSVLAILSRVALAANIHRHDHIIRRDRLSQQRLTLRLFSSAR